MLLDTSILRLPRLFLYGNAPHYQNGCRSKTITTGGLKTVGLNTKKGCYVPFSSEKPIAIGLVKIGEKPMRRAFLSETSQGNLGPAPPFGSMTATG